MKTNSRWKALSWRHPVWELIRFHRALRGNAREEWPKSLKRDGAIRIEDTTLPIDGAHIDVLVQYLDGSPRDLETAFSHLRKEEEANAFCKTLGVTAKKTKTKSQQHHQSSKALIAAVSTIAQTVCTGGGLEIETDPQRRCIWCTKKGLHVTARNLDGAIPSLLNPIVVWEIKEYWGKTQGGSKMSDAVYECNLVGRELREFEERTGTRVAHIVFLDGKDQWSKRKSDLVRFIDLFHQGVIDYLFVGDEVETEWQPLLRALVV